MRTADHVAAHGGGGLPPHLSTGDPNSFAMRTITWRKPRIAEQVIEANGFSGETRSRVLALKEEMERGVITDPFLDSGLSDAELGRLFVPEERAAWQRTIDGCRGRPWVGIPWYVAESMFYLRLLFATGYYDPDSERFLRDPFAPMKDRELHGAGGGREVLRRLAADLRGPASDREALGILLASSLWGNRVDLSNFDIAEQQRGSVLDRGSAAMLVDHREAVGDRLLASRRLDFIMDNSGAELACDLALVDFLLRRDAARRVVLHLKRTPFFVSDTMVKDAREAMDAFAGEHDPAVAAIGARLIAAVVDGRLEFRDHFFWNGPLHFVDLPPDLRAELGRSDLVLAKGDANYRRFLSDRHWEPWRSLQELTAYFPAPFAVLRTMKSEIVVDIPRERVEELARTDPVWMVDGKRGIVRLCDGGRAPTDG